MHQSVDDGVEASLPDAGKARTAASLNGRIFFLGGPSGAGKSWASRVLVRRHGVPVSELDEYHIALMPSIPDQTALNDATYATVQAAVREMIRIRVGCVTEGIWMRPETAARLRDEFPGAFHPVFCGIPNARPEVRYAFVRERKDHWLKYKTEAEALEILRREIHASHKWREECQRLSIPFFDFSDLRTGQMEFFRHFDAWLRTPAA